MQALAHQQTALRQHRADLLKQTFGQVVLFQPIAEVRHRRRVGHRVTAQLAAGKAAQRLTVVQRILDRLAGQPVPLLHKVDPQHPLQPNRWPAALALGIKRPRIVIATAVEMARQQRAQLLGAAAATGLARLHRDRGCSAAAIALLQPVYERFTEGFDTADLTAAKELLDDLQSAIGGEDRG